MENNFFYSASMNCFYPANWTGKKPDDLKPVTDDVVKEFSSISPAGKVRGAGSDGLPAWVDDTENSSTESYEMLKSALMTSAGQAIAPLQDASDLGVATDAEKTLLTAWKTYRVDLMRVDTTKPVWPTPPD